MNCTIELKNLTKKYGAVTVLDNLNIKLKKEKILVVGNNGSGKTTFIKCILNFLKYHGSIKIVGDISYAPDKLYLPDVKVKDFFKNLNIKVNNIFDLDLESRIKKLSKGNKQKINLLQCLNRETDIYILDEPLDGLDKYSKQSFLNELKMMDKLIIVVSQRKEEYDFFEKVITFK